jgi:hypothetical protein
MPYDYNSEYSNIIEPKGGYDGLITGMSNIGGKLYVFTTNKTYVVQRKSKLRIWIEVLLHRFKKRSVSEWRSKELS